LQFLLNTCRRLCGGGDNYLEVTYIENEQSRSHWTSTKLSYWSWLGICLCILSTVFYFHPVITPISSCQQRTVTSSETHDLTQEGARGWLAVTSTGQFSQMAPGGTFTWQGVDWNAVTRDPILTTTWSNGAGSSPTGGGDYGIQRWGPVNGDFYYIRIARPADSLAASASSMSLFGGGQGVILSLGTSEEDQGFCPTGGDSFFNFRWFEMKFTFPPGTGTLSMEIYTGYSTPSSPSQFIIKALTLS